jgi:hypothetical protein
MNVETYKPPFWQRVWNRLRTLETATRCEIFYDNDGLRAEWRDPSGAWTRVALEWDEVTSVVAFKRDVFTVDLICLAFNTADRVCEINEEMIGYKALVKHLPTFLPGCLQHDDWFQRVAFPAFVPNATEIYSRPANS